MATLLELASRELGSPTVESVLRLSVKLAQAANDLKGFSEADKMSLVLSTLRETLNDPLVKDKLGAEEHVKLIALVDTVIPETLTLCAEAAAAARREIDLRKPSVGCFAPLFCRAVTVLTAAPSVDVSGSVVPAPAPSPPAAPVASPAEVAVAVPKDTDNSAPAPPPETTAPPSS